MTSRNASKLLAEPADRIRLAKFSEMKKVSPEKAAAIIIESFFAREGIKNLAKK